jgi:predicted ester cyclase
VLPGYHRRAVSRAAEAVTAYWEAANERNWDAFAGLLSADVVYEGPQTRERVRGAENYVRFNVEGFPGPWHLRILRVVAEGTAAASWIDFTNADGTSQPGLCFFELDEEGKIDRITDFWPEPYELPAQRAHLVERF